jgi:hypothetical protein
MTKESSQRLLKVQYLQSDIAFKCVAGFLEFETGGWNQNAQIGLSKSIIYFVIVVVIYPIPQP